MARPRDPGESSGQRVLQGADGVPVRLGRVVRRGRKEGVGVAMRGAERTAGIP